MNRIDKMMIGLAIEWIKSQGIEIIGNYEDSDFIYTSGNKRYKSKFLYGNQLIFSKLQYGQLRDDDTILVFDRDFQFFVHKFLWKDRNKLSFEIRLSDEIEDKTIQILRENLKALKSREGVIRKGLKAIKLEEKEVYEKLRTLKAIKKESYYEIMTQCQSNYSESIEITQSKYRGLPTNVILNKSFEGSHIHHMTPFVAVYIPEDLHKSIYHNLKTGEGMEEINAKSMEWISKSKEGSINNS